MLAVLPFVWRTPANVGDMALFLCLGSLGALAHYEGAVVLVSHDSGAVQALNPERVLIMPEGTEDHWTADYLDLITLA